MAGKKIKFALKMADGTQVRHLEDLRWHIKNTDDLKKIVEYFLDGRLVRWVLQDERKYEKEAMALKSIDKNDPNFAHNLCKAIGIDYTPSEPVNLDLIKYEMNKRKAKEEAERKAKEEAERKAKEEAERKAKEEAERKAKEEAKRKAKEEAERKAKEEAKRKAKEEAKRKANEEAKKTVEEKSTFLRFIDGANKIVKAINNFLPPIKEEENDYDCPEIADIDDCSLADWD